MWRRATYALSALGLALGLSITQNPLNAQLFRQSHHEPPPPPSLTDVARMIDSIESSILNQGTVVIKQPDIWSQARMTKFRKEFEDTMALELGQFQTRLNARIARSDAAAFSSQTALGASLTPLDPTVPFQLGSMGEVTSERNAALSGLVVANGTQQTFSFPDATLKTPTSNFSLLGNLAMLPEGSTKTLGAVNMPFGLEPTIELDQHANYITHLHRLRRINLGDDNADSAGYGLYLMRVPVSIQPGDRTVKGHGAIVTLTMQHDFGPNFLASAYRNLVINDVIDKLGGPTHELIRSGTAQKYRDFIGQFTKNSQQLVSNLEQIRSNLIAAPEIIGGRDLARLVPSFPRLPSRLDTTYIQGLPEILQKFEEDLNGFRSTLEQRVLDARREEQDKLLALGKAEKVLEERKQAAQVSLERARGLTRDYVAQLRTALPERTALLGDAAALQSLPSLTGAPIAELLPQAAANSLGSSISEKAEALNTILSQLNEEFPAVPTAMNYSQAIQSFESFLDSDPTTREFPREVQELPDELLEARQAADKAAEEASQAASELALIENETSEAQRAAIEAAEAAKAYEEARKKSEDIQNIIDVSLSDIVSTTATQIQALQDITRSVGFTLPVNRTGSRINAVAPSDLPRIFLPENLLDLAYEAQVALDLVDRPQANSNPQGIHWKVKLTDVRSYLRHELEAAYDLMAGSDRTQPALLMDIPFIEAITDGVTGRTYEGTRDVDPNSQLEVNALREVYSTFIGRLPGNLSRRPVGVLSWAIAVEAGLLNRHLQEDMQQVTGEEYACPPDVEGMFFYTPIPTPEAEFAFQEYVKARWPMITFALEPVTDQQNIEDAFTRRRDLQLAVAFALASGRISFRQALQFTRQLQYEAQTIALNQTVTAFAHANDTFGWRFSPRYQTPPEESNPLAVANLLTRGGPGPNYQIKNSKIEPGMRELTAVVVMPSFVRGLRVDASSDWYPLHDPDERKIKTAKTLAHGHRINEAREALAMAEVCGYYRPEDVERLRVRLLQLERLLPMQTSRVQVPYENTLGGFALFTQGVTALVPQLTGFEGIEYLDATKGADILVHGKNFSIYEMEVVAGGKMLLREGTATTFLDDQKKALVMGTTITPLRSASNKLVVLDKDGKFQETNDVGTYNIVSREVLRVRIPENVEKSTRSDGQEFVELFVSTPNGISNRLQIPTGPPPSQEKAAAPTPAPTFSPSPTGTDYAFIDSEMIVRLDAVVEGNKITAMGINSVSPESLRLQPIDRAQKPDRDVEVTLWFPAPGLTNAVAPELTLVLDKRSGDSYEFNSDHLKRIAERLRELMVLSNNAIPEEITSKSVTVTPLPRPSSRPSATTNQLRVRFEYVLRPKPVETPTTMSAPMPDRTELAGDATEQQPAPHPAVEFASSGQAFGDERTDALFRDTAVSPASGINPSPVAVQARFRQEDEASVPAEGEIPPPAAPIQVQVSLPPLPDGVAAGTAAARAVQPSQTLVVLPQQAPSINVAVPITNQQPAKHSRLFRREPATPANPTRPPLLERLRGGF